MVYDIDEELYDESITPEAMVTRCMEYILQLKETKPEYLKDVQYSLQQAMRSLELQEDHAQLMAELRYDPTNKFGGPGFDWSLKEKKGKK